MFPTGRCRNCGVPTHEILCNSCRNHRRCTRCYRYLPAHLFPIDSDVCNACQNRDVNNVGRYCLDRVIGDRTWYGTTSDIDVSNFVQHHAYDITTTFESARNENTIIKYFFEMEVEFHRTAQDGDVQHTTARFYVPPMTSDVNELDLQDIITQLLGKIDGFSGKNSGWNVSQIKHIRLCWGCYRPLVAGSFVPTPKFIATKRAITNIQCFDDDNCFQYSVLAGMNLIHFGPHDRKDRPSTYKPFMHMLNMDGIQTPVPLSSISKFENLNPDISVNVLYLDNRDIVPIRTSKFCNQRKYHVNLLMLTSDEKFHYTSIQSLSRLVCSRTKSKSKAYVCQYCLHPFCKEDYLNEHLAMCSQHEAQQITYPKPGNDTLKFTKFQYQFEVPFTIYADFECFLQKDTDQSDTHIPSGFCALTTSIFQEHDYKLFCYSGENVMDEFFAHMRREEERIDAILSMNVEMDQLTPEQQSKHDEARLCISCDEEFLLENPKTRHHCHVSGRYIGPVCQSCNLQLKYRTAGKHFFIPCFFHNSAAYDSHLLIKNFHQKESKITVIPSNTEKFIGFQIDGIRYLDSFKFLPSSLDDLVENLHNDGIDHFKYTKHTFGDSDPNIFKKAVFSYEHMTDRDVFEQTSLPPRESFYSQLKMEGISEEEYERAQLMWNRYGCQNMQHYHDLYLTLDVTLLADVMENFRRVGIQEYGLDPAHCWTLAGYTWQCCLKMTKMQLQLITDPNIFLFFENSIRGGVSTVSNRYAKANNKYLNDFDPSQPSSYILSYDVVNLYGYCMLSKLPCGKFRFLDEPEKFDFRSVQVDGDTGYLLEVDFVYPTELHDVHSALPLAPQHMKVTPEMLSEYNTDPNFRGQTSLIPNLYDKTKYVLHIKNLQLYTELGLKVAKIHKVLAFEQKAFLAPYIQFNTEKRRLARTSFEKDFFKLMSNAVYGKTIEQMRDRMHIRLISDQQVAKRYIRKPTCQRFQIINTDLVMVHLGKRRIEMNKPIYAGMVVLDIAKTVVYDFHYRYMLQKYSPNNVSLLFTDTDSLTYVVQTDDIYEDMKPDAHQMFDCSDYPKSHMLHSSVNKKRLGCWKDENSSGRPIRQYVGLRAKMYSILSDDNTTKVKAKGIVKAYRRHKLRHTAFLTALREKKTSNAEFRQFKSSNHVIRTVTVKKICLSPFDCKRFILKCGEKTLAFGHYSLTQDPSRPR